MTLNEALLKGIKILKEASISDSGNESKFLLSDVLDESLLYPVVFGEKKISERDYNLFLKFINERAKGIPRQYITGRTDFFGLSFLVGYGVFIPRPETELLVEKTLSILKNRKGFILEPCTGSAAISLALSKNNPDIDIIALDLSPEALKWAKKNLKKYKNISKKITLVKSDLLSSVKNNCDILAIICNPPYIPSKNINYLEPEVKLHEPPMSLDGGEKGLTVINRIILQSADILPSGTFLIMELGIEQSEKVKKMLQKSDFHDIEIYTDFQNISRIIKAVKK